MMFLYFVLIFNLYPVLYQNIRGYKLYWLKNDYFFCFANRKILRLIDIKQKIELQRFLCYIEEGKIGEIKDYDVSRDLRYLCMGGIFLKREEILRGKRNPIRIFDISTGKLIKNFYGHNGEITGVRFSKDGEYIFSMGTDRKIIKWDFETGKQEIFALLESEPICMDISSNEEYLVVGCKNGKIYLFYIPTKEIVNEGRHLIKVNQVKFTYDDRFIVSAGGDGILNLWDGKSLEFICKLIEFKKALAPYGVSMLDLSPMKYEGIVGIFYNDNKGRVLWFSFDQKGIRKKKELIKWDDTVRGGTFSPDGSYIAVIGGSKRDIYIFDSTGTKIDSIPQNSKFIYSLAFLKDGSGIAYGYSHKKVDKLFKKLAENGVKTSNWYDSLEFIFNWNKFKILPYNQEPVYRCIDSVGGYRVKIKKSGLSSYIDDLLEIYYRDSLISRILKTEEEGSRHRNYTFTPDARYLISGGFDGKIFAYDIISGKKIAEFEGLDGLCFSLAIDPERMLLSAADKSRICVWNLNELYKNKQIIKPIFSIFVGVNSEWVIYMPSGHYVSSLEGDKYVGFINNKNYNLESEFIFLNDLKKRFFLPELINKIIESRSKDTAVFWFEKNYSTKITDFYSVLEERPPKIFITSPEEGEVIKSNKIRLKIEIVFPKKYKIKILKISVNGSNVITESSPQFNKTEDMPPFVRGTITYNLYLKNGVNFINVTAENEIGVNRAFRKLICKFKEKKHIINLNLVSIGISKYKKKINLTPLKFADDDARSISKIFKSQEGLLYNKVNTFTLIDKDATKDTILGIFEYLVENSQRNDITIIFIACHGIYSQKLKGFFIVPYNGDPDKPLSTCIWLSQIKAILSNIKGKIILMVDACHSGYLASPLIARGVIPRGSPVITSLLKEFERAGDNMTVLSSSQGDEYSYEVEELKHGIFTYAILKSLSKEADFDHDGVIKLSEFLKSVSEIVKKIAQEYDLKQTPLISSTVFVDYPLFIIKNE